MIIQITLIENSNLSCIQLPSYAITLEHKVFQKNIDIYDEIKRINEPEAPINKDIPVAAFQTINRYSY